MNTLFQEKTEHHNQKDGSKGTQRLGPYWKLQPVICMVSMELTSEFGPRTEAIVTPGSEPTQVCDEFEQHCGCERFVHADYKG